MAKAAGPAGSAVLDWLRAMWAMVDERLRETSEKLQRIVKLVRVTLAVLIVAIVLVLLSPIVLFVWPKYFPIAYAVSTVILVVPVVVLTVLVALPLRLKSVIRLIDKGYPGNAKELAIRVAARKLHDQSIETEELLVETAINEGKKVLRRMDEARAAADAAAPVGAAPAGSPVPDGEGRGT